MLAPEQQPDNPEAPLTSIFRSFHTIKGNAGFLGLVPMQAIAHEVESLLVLARNYKLRLYSAIVTEILRSRDALQTLNQQVARALETGTPPDEIVPVGHLIEAVKKLASSNGSAGATVELAEIASPVAVTIPKAAPAAAVEHALVPSAETVSSGPKVAPTSSAAVKSTAGATVRVNTEKLDSLMDVVGELVIVQSQLLETARAQGDNGSPLQRNVAQLSRITKELQHTAMALRMIPIKPTFQKMERLARDSLHPARLWQEGAF